jgi:hypothetical protein
VILRNEFCAAAGGHSVRSFEVARLKRTSTDVVLSEAVKPPVVADPDGFDLARAFRVERRLGLGVGRVDDDLWVVGLDDVDRHLVVTREGKDLRGGEQADDKGGLEMVRRRGSRVDKD